MKDNTLLKHFLLTLEFCKKSEIEQTSKLLYNSLVLISKNLKEKNADTNLTFNERIKTETLSLSFELSYAQILGNTKIQNIKNTLINIRSDNFITIGRVIDDDYKFKQYINRMLKNVSTKDITIYLGKEWVSNEYQPAVISNIDLMIKRLGNVKTYSYTHNSCYKDFCTERQKNLKIAKEIVLDKFNNIKKKEDIKLEKKKTRKL